MPKISQLEAPDNLGLRPTEVGITATAAAARRVGSEYSEAAAAQATTGKNIAEAVQGIGTMALKFAEHMELSTGMAEAAKLEENLIKGKDAQIAKLDPNDPAYAQKVEGITQQWREKTLEPALNDFSRGFLTTKGQAWAQNFTTSTRESMFKHSTADVVAAAGISAKNNFKTMVSVSSNEALRDPGRAQEILQRLETNVNTLVSTSPMKGTQAAKFRTELLDDGRRRVIEAASIGGVRSAKDPEAEAAKWIADYPEYIDGHKALALADNARRQIVAREADAHRAELREKEARREASSDASNQYLVEAQSRDPKLAADPVAVKVLNDPTLTKQDRSNLLNLISRQLKPETDTRISNETMVSFLKEMKPGSDVDDQAMLQRIWDARVKDPGTPGSLTENHFKELRKELAERKTPEGMALSSDRTEFFKRYAPQIDPTLGAGALENQKMYEAQKAARRLEADLRKQGKDPSLVYEPTSEYFFGKPENIAKYRPTMAEKAAFDRDQKALQNRKDAPKPPAATAPPPPPDKPREFTAREKEALKWANDNPGEKADAIKKRLGM